LYPEGKLCDLSSRGLKKTKEPLGKGNGNNITAIPWGGVGRKTAFKNATRSEYPLEKAKKNGDPRRVNLKPKKQKNVEL